MKTRLVAAMFAVALAVVGIFGAGVSAQPASPTFSVVVHFKYEDGFTFDYTIATGVPAPQLHTYLAQCGQSHWTKSVVKYHCFPVAE